jgi:hypothetical protein
VTLETNKSRRSKVMKSTLAVVVAAILMAMSAQLMAQDAPVLRVLVVETDNPAAYVKEVQETGQAHMKRLGIRSTIRMWKAKYAGRDAGSMVVSIEYPSLMALAEDDRRIAADPAMRAWIKELDKIRKIVSDSLYSEAK